MIGNSWIHIVNFKDSIVVRHYRADMARFSAVETNGCASDRVIVYISYST